MSLGFEVPEQLKREDEEKDGEIDYCGRRYGEVGQLVFGTIRDGST